MKKILLLLLLAVFITASFSAAIPVNADSAQILRNPGFEEDIDFWTSAVTATLVAMESYDGVTPQAGKNFVYTDNRYGYADSPMQPIHKQLNFYGEGSYQISAYMRLPASSSVSTAKAKIVIMTVSTDKSSETSQFPGTTWHTSPEVTISKTSWTLVQGTVELQWSQNLERGDFYFITNQGDPVTNLCIDSASMIKTGYTGPVYTFPSPTAKPNSPTPRPTNPVSSSSAAPSATPTTPVSQGAVSSSAFSYRSQPVSAGSAQDSSEALSAGNDSAAISQGTSTAGSASEISMQSEHSIASEGSTAGSAVSTGSSVPQEKDGVKIDPAVVIVVLIVMAAAAALLAINLRNRKLSGQQPK